MARLHMALLALPLLCSGCQLLEMDRQVKQVQQELLLVAGQLDAASPSTALVALLDGQGKALSYRIVAPGNDFYFTVPHGTYQLLAFADDNGNFRLDPDETRHWLAPARSVALSLQPDDATRATLLRSNRLLLGGTAAAADAPDVDLSLDKLYENRPRLRSNYLQQVALDDPRFDPQRISQGAWEPLDYLREVGYGLYLLEPWSDDKEPVFLVHGINDSPRTWQALLDGLDRQRFQAVLFHYPGSLPLGNSAYLLSEAIQDVQLRHGVRRFHIVAHSMGGLVARRAVQLLEANAGSQNLCLFLTLATPWDGHPAAATGLKQAPVVVPTWRDLAPGSPYLQALFAGPLPAHVRQWLLVSYGGNSRLLAQPNDGVVPLASQLRGPAQDEAEHLYLLEESHTSILHSERSKALLARAMDSLPASGCAP
ncbi:alpha/beta fold hydrolase [Pseudomonas sp. R-28-1W-6]|uniref:alpha/beta fold hydrolase n=1 Tax=Pseudomonas sp. R-28-1W-6 TaxID=2650101 RepID=UPI0013658323|nr:alpha/beta fold hydrolase [Pseudomonas sp. R-28-1W-6]MWV10526.1 alpha/beta fold hydrolase [Pseudomonas sp. R-28-1W-6]